ncbi:MAG: cytochrome P450 [Salinarimonadaceae bacterium]|nr:MAG: cytochrome P450 [Salinarimonadaceae bacterium]
MTQGAPFRLRPPAPPPRASPPDLFGFLSAARANPLTTWTRAHYEKPIVYGKGVMGRVLVVNDPAAIRHVLLDNAANYRKDDLQRRVLAPGLGEGLLTAEGEQWRLLRRTLAPLFNARNVTGFAPIMDEAARRLVARLLRREGRVRDAALEMTRVTLDVLERTIFTHGLDRDPDALSRAITRFFEAVGPIDPLDVLGLPDFLPRIGRIRARPAMRFFEEVVNELVGRRKALIEAGGNAPRDLLTLLLEARDPETGEPLDELSVRANIVTFIGAGHETTANALTWTLYLLARAPDALARLVAEVDAHVTDAPLDPATHARLPWLKAVIEEAMRLYPPVPFMSREALSEDRIAGIRVPAGTLVTIAPWVLHRHRTLWKDPEVFDPERFTPENRESIDRFAYLPFGAGPRVCIGQSFSMQEMMTVLARLVRSVSFELAPGCEVAPLHRVTLRPDTPVLMRMRARPDQAARGMT